MSWGALEKGAPELAAFGAARFWGGVAYLATVREDRSPRVHPVTPIVGEGRLMLYIEPTSPKGKDLERDGRYQLHCAVETSGGGEGEFYVRGQARLVSRDETALWELAARVGYKPKPQYVLFEFSVESAFSTVYEGNEVVRKRWKADTAAG